MAKRLYRSRDNHKLAGVCGGIAEYFNMDPTIIRLLSVAAILITDGIGLIAYIVAAVIVPVAPKDMDQAFEKSTVEDIKRDDVVDVDDFEEVDE